MPIPSLGPFLCIVVNAMEEKVVQEPNMLRKTGIQAMIDFEVNKELFPFEAKAMCDVVPEALNPGIVNAPGQMLSSQTTYFIEKPYLPQI
jgi:hypothetical protein